MKNFSLNIKKSGSRGNLLAVLLTVTASLLLSVSAYGWNYAYLRNSFYWGVTSCNVTCDDSNCTEGHKDFYLSGNYDFYFCFSANSKGWQAASKDLVIMPSTLGGSSDTKTAGQTTDNYETMNKFKITNSTFKDEADFIKYKVAYSATGSNFNVTVTASAVTDLVAGLTANTLTVRPGATVSLTMTAAGGTGSWSSKLTCTDDAGTFSSSTSTTASKNVTWTAPSIPGTYTITNTVRDANITSDEGDGQNKNANVNYTDAASVVISVVAGTPTVFNAKEPVVSGFDATLSGYLKYTGCETIVANGFIVSDELEDMQGDTPVGTYTTNSVASMAAGDLFSRTDSYQNGTYYYRSYVKTDGDDEYYSPKTDIGSFVINGSCDPEATVTAVIDKESAVLSAGVAASLSTPTNAALYNWVCVTSPTSSTVTFSTQTKRNTDVTVDMAGDYTFKLQAKCSEEVSYRESSTVSLHVCAAPTVQQLYLDEEIANIICAGEKSTATIYSQEGYDYTLTSATKNYGTQVGSGATLTWRNVDGIGTYTVIASEHGTGLCQASMTAATQIESSAKLVVNASSLSAIAYQSVTLTVDDDASKIDHAPEWTITAGPSGYLVDVDTRLVYDAGKQRSSVDFKGGATTATTYTVSASTTYTTVLPHTSKVCDASTEVNIQVSPATEKCD